MKEADPTLKEYLEIRSSKDYDKNYTVIEYDLNDKKIKKYCKQVRAYRKFLNKFNIKYQEGTHFFIKRIFNNGSIENGGRYYASYQSMPYSENSHRKTQTLAYRKNITIDEFSTSEIDFSAIHPNLIYAIENLENKNDAYKLEGVDRRLTKLWLLMSLNGDSFYSVGYCFLIKLLEEHFNISFNEMNKLSKEFVQKRNEIYSLEEKIDKHFKDNYPLISKHFYTGIGSKLQFHDSEIMRNILENCKAENICAIPVHDSIVVPAAYENRAIEIMQFIYKEYCKKVFKTTNPQINVEIKL
jgi:hypothetical protein